MLRFLLLIILTWQSTEQLRLSVERSVNIITLICFNEQDMPIDLETNTSIKFFLNRTVTGSSMMDELERSVSLQKSETTATFTITPKLEGYFACGSSTGPSIVTSQPKPLIVLPSSDGFPVNGEMVYAVQSEDGAATIPCPFEPGNLQTCYYGEWTKNGTRIAGISKPDASCGSGGMFTSINTTKYQVNRKTFSLTISSVNAKDDSDQYECQLQVLNPATSTGQTNDFRSFSVTLIVNGQPMITEAPRDVVIGLDTTGEGLMETATFNCTALGRPIPEIEWFYITINPDGTLGMPVRLMGNGVNIVNNDNPEDPTRRFQRTSTLTMAVTENNGGIIRCQADRSTEDARLTVLSQPSINIIATLRGEIIYDIGLKVHIYHPVALNFTYQDVDSGVYYSRDSQPDETYNDTKEITYRENKDDVPGNCRKCRVAMSLSAVLGNKVMQGLPVTSSDVIDLEARTPQQTIEHLRTTIAISCAILVSIIGVGAITIIVVVCCCLLRNRKQKEKQKEEQLKLNHKHEQETLTLEHKHKEEQLESEHRHKEEKLKSEHTHKNEIAYKHLESIEENVTDLGSKTDEVDRKEMIKRIKKKLEELKEFMKEEAIQDDCPQDTPQVDLKQVDKCLEELLSKFKTQRRR